MNEMLANNNSIFQQTLKSWSKAANNKHPDTSPYPLIARPDLGLKNNTNYGFSYNTVDFFQEGLQICAGLNAVEHDLSHVTAVMQVLQKFNLNCTRMGLFKPRTSPYSFQGVGLKCLPHIFEQAGKYGIKVIAVEITHEKYLAEIEHLLDNMGNPTGLMLQIGTRNTQNFELLKALGSQNKFPLLLKRGYGISLEESLLAAEYLAAAGNSNIVFCLRGVKSVCSGPHRNFVDFAQVPVIKRLTKLPVCIDPSHAVGDWHATDNTSGIPDILHATAQGIIAGASMALIDIHPNPKVATVDARQAISLKQLPWLLDDMQIVREAYAKRKQRAATES